MRSLPAIIAVFIASAILSPADCGAAAASAILQVSATVRPWIKFRAEQHVRSYRVTSADISRGYVDLPASATVVISTNERKQVVISVASGGPERILVREAGSGAFVEAGSSVDPAGHATGAAIARTLDYRVMIPAGTQEGVYALNAAITPQIH